jgi:hypothetical protein
MKMMKHIQTWLLITLLALSANGVANAKLASGPQNLSADLHQSQTVLNALLHQGLGQVSTTNTSESPLATKGAAKLCFVEGTPVHTKDGLKSIEEIEVGDLVASKNDETGEIDWKPVVELFRNNDKEVLNVSFASISGKLETLGVTAEHPFWVEGKGWTNAGDLNIGDDITTLENGVVKVATIGSDAKTHTTYNFEVEDFHTYFVGESALWVHNMCELTGAGRRALGNLTDLKDTNAAAAILSRGGNGSIVRETLGDKFKDKTVGQIANAVGEGVEGAKKALKGIKDAKRLANKGR